MEDLKYMDNKVISLIRGAIRRSFVRYSPAYQEAIKNSVSQNEFGPKGGKRLICASCGGTFAQKDVDVDHIHSVVSDSTTVKRMTLEAFYKAVWTEASNLQVLCTGCHDAKTKLENQRRRDYKKSLKVKNDVNIIKKVKKKKE